MYYLLYKLGLKKMAREECANLGKVVLHHTCYVTNRYGTQVQHGTVHDYPDL